MEQNMQVLQNRLFNIIKLLILLIVLAMVIFGFMSGQKGVETEVILYGTAENKFNADGFLIRGETVINSPAEGILNLNVQENEKVAKGQVIATVFSGTVDEETRNKLNTLNERIADLENTTIDKVLTVGDAVTADSTIKSRVDDIVTATYNNDLSHISQYKDDITALLASKSGSTGNDENEMAANSAIEQLRKEKKDIERSIVGERFEIRAGSPGVFSSNIDGYEDYFDFSNITALTPSDIEEAREYEPAVETEITKGTPCVKISDNFEWYFVANVDARWGSDIEPQESIKLRFPEISDDLVPAYVKHVSEKEDGLVTIIVACSDYSEDIYTLREINADIVRTTYSGFKLPKTSIRVNEKGESGVYVVRENIAKFRNISVIFTGEDYVIAAEDNTINNPLLLYDEVIISSENITEGMKVN